MPQLQRYRTHGLLDLIVPQVKAERDQQAVDLKNFNPAFATGHLTAAECLASVGINFQDVRSIITGSSKPALNVGCSHSTLACEADMRGLPFFSTDLRCSTNRDTFLAKVRDKLQNLEPDYLTGSHAEGFQFRALCTSEWGNLCSKALRTLDNQLSECSSSDIKMPDGSKPHDRHFSLVISTNAVPQYVDYESFLRNELPELLRVTQHSLYLAPFTFKDFKVEDSAGKLSRAEAEVGNTAHSRGFRFSLTRNNGQLAAKFIRR